MRAFCASALLWSALACRALDPETRIEDYILAAWDTEAGLPNEAVRHLIQTRDGYLWIGTPRGVARFDGLHFSIFDHHTSPAFSGSDYISSFAETPDGSLWIGTDGPLVRYHHGTLTAYTQADGLKPANVNCLTLGADGTLWIAGRAGITRWVNEKFLTDIPSPMPSMLGLSDLFVDTDNSLWICIGPNIYVYRDGNYKMYGRNEGLPEARVLQLLRDRDKALLAITQDGIYQFQADRFVPVPWNARLSSRRVSRAFVDRDGNLWVGTVGGLDRVRDGEVTRYDNDRERRLGVVDALFEDREGELWLGTSEGVRRLTDRRAYTLSQADGISGTLALSLAQTRDGAIWISTWGSGVDRLQDGKITHLGQKEGLSHETVTVIYEAPDGVMWFGNRASSVDRYDGHSVQTMVYTPGVPSNRPVTMFYTDDDGTLLLGIHRRGLLQLKDGAISPVPEANVFSTGTVWFMRRGSQGRLLLGTDSGLYERRADRTFARVEIPGFPGNVSVRDMVESEGGVRWIASETDGLIRWDGTHAVAYGTDQRLVADSIFGLLEDRLGYLWICSPRGLARIRESDFAKSASSTKEINTLVFGRVDGLATSATAGSGSPAALQLKDGRLMFATNRGVAVVNPSKIPVNVQPPTIAIESVRADDEQLSVHGPVSIRAGTRRVEFRYTALSLVAPHRLRFRYKLEGLDPNWIDAGNERIAHYTGLPPGAYLFRVIACNNDGVWNEEGVALPVVMQAWFYQTVWFRALVGVAAAGAIVVVFWLRVRQLKRRQQSLARANAELNARVQERTAELSRSNQELGQRESLFRLIFEHAPLGVSWHRTDLGGEYHFNRAFRRILDLPAETLPDNSVFMALVHPSDAPRHAELEAKIRSGAVDSYTVELRFSGKDGRTIWGLLASAVVRDEKGAVVQVIGLLEDITARKAAEDELAATHKRLLDASRMAGMAEVATGVLHDVGNVLNSVNVSADVLASGLRESRIEGVGKIARLLKEHADHIGDFMARDPQGARVVPYLESLAGKLEDDRKRLQDETESLRQRVEHIKEIVTRQQAFAQLRGLFERLSPAELVEEALRMNEVSLGRHDVVVERDFQPAPQILADRHKALQILINLIRNAKQAMRDCAPGEKRLRISIHAEADVVKFNITDSGVGIPPENLTRIFNHGFTTRANGHGFGLHASANAAREMHGNLTAQSEGVGKGATFVLTLPVEQKKSSGAGETRGSRSVHPVSDAAAKT